MFFRLGLLILLLALIPAKGAYAGDPQYDEFGNRIESNNDDAEEQEGESEPPPPELDFPKMFDATIGGGFGYGLPVGEFYTGLDSGPLYFGEIRFAFSPKVYLKFTYRKMNIFKDSAGVSDEDGTYLGTVDLSLDVHEYFASMGWLSSPNKNNKLRMYGEFGAGHANHVITVSMDSQSISDDEGEFMFAGQIGVLVPFSNGPVGLDVGGSVLFKPITFDQGNDWGALFAAHLGLVFMIGGGADQGI